MIAIPDMSKPKTCEDCPCAYFTEGAYTDECQVTHNHITDEKPTDCPLIEIVRCGECKWKDECILGCYGVSEQGFCYKGERRADEKTL